MDDKDEKRSDAAKARAEKVNRETPPKLPRDDNRPGMTVRGSDA